MNLGDKVRFSPWPWTREKTEWGNGMQIPTSITGKVIYLHPAGRFYCVEALVDGRPIRECFHIPRR